MSSEITYNMPGAYPQSITEPTLDLTFTLDDFLQAAAAAETYLEIPSPVLELITLDDWSPEKLEILENWTYEKLEEQDWSSEALSTFQNYVE
jgi:hypothetical protein